MYFVFIYYLTEVLINLLRQYFCAKKIWLMKAYVSLLEYFSMHKRKFRDLQKNNYTETYLSSYEGDSSGRFGVVSNYKI